MSHKTLCGAVQSKFWGKTQCIFVGHSSEMHFASAIKGGFCSEHKHDDKWNRFFIVSGKLKVVIFKNGGKDETVIETGQFTDVPPGEWHTFECVEDCEFIEVYWINTLNSSDIDRRTSGGSCQDLQENPQNV